MKLAYHYAMESKGKETTTARLLKATPFSRRWYYSNARYSVRDRTLPKKLERTDREAREVKLLCPHKCAPVFRKFLIESRTLQHLEERARLARQIVLQLREAPAFDNCSFSVRDTLKGQLDELSARLLNSKPSTLSRTHVHLNFIRETKNMPVTLPILWAHHHADEFSMSAVRNAVHTERPMTTWKDLTLCLSQTPPDVPLESWDAQLKKARFFHAMFAGVIGAASISLKILGTAWFITYGGSHLMDKFHDFIKLGKTGLPVTQNVRSSILMTEYDLIHKTGILYRIEKTASSGTKQESLQ